MWHTTERRLGHTPLISGRSDRASGRVVAGLCVLVFVCGLGMLAALVPVGHGLTPKGGGWFVPSVVGGVFTLHPLLVAVPWAACFVLGLLDWRRPWQVGQLDLLALAGFFPATMLLSDDFCEDGLGLAAVCLGWLFCRMLGAAFGAWPMPKLCPSVSSRRLGLVVLVLLAVRIGSLAGGNIVDVGRASSLGAWRVLHGLPLYGAVSWQWPGAGRIYRPDSYGPFAYYAYLPFAIVFPPASAPVLAVLATLVPAACFDVLTLVGLCRLGRRLGGRPLARAFAFAYLLYPFPDLSLMAETNDALIAALCVWAVVVGAERPAVRGLLMAAAALTKFLPALLALQFLGVRRGRYRYALTLAASLAAMLAWPVVTSGPARFLGSTLGYQLVQRGGGVQFSIWTYLPHPVLAARPVLAAALVLLALSPMLRPRAGDPRKDAALAAALLIGAQLLLGYWFYSYLTWCYPLLIIAIIQAPPDHEAAQNKCDYTPLAWVAVAYSSTCEEHMMTYPASPNDVNPNRVRPDSSQFWAGGVATAVVAALIALVGIMVCRWTLGIPILAPASDGAWGSAHTGEYVLVAACVALVATGLLYLLVLGTPQPGMFFGWIMGLATLVAVVYPFSTSAPLDQKFATAAVDLVLGVAITSLLTAVSARAVRVRRSGPPSRLSQPAQPGQPGQDVGYVPDRRTPEPTQPINVPRDPGARQWR